MALAEYNLPLLFARLHWPDTIVRGRAAYGIGELLRDARTRDVCTKHFLSFIHEQTCETRVTDALLSICRLKEESEDVSELATAAINEIRLPSLLSALICSYLLGEDLELDLSNLHSGDAPSEFASSDYFEKYKRSFVPPIFDLRGEAIEKKHIVAFRRQWAFEIEQVFKRCGEPLMSGYPEYFFGMASERITAVVDLPQSDVFRSGFLRALAWLSEKKSLPEFETRLLALEACPIDVGCWIVRDAERPQWWPNVSVSGSEKIDLSVEEIIRDVECLWESEMEQNGESVLVYASGIVPRNGGYDDSDRQYYLEIQGVFQKFVGGDLPDLEELVSELNRRSSLWSPGQSISIRGSMPQADLADVVSNLGGWTILPASLRLNRVPPTRWQPERFDHEICIPASYLFNEEPPRLEPTINALEIHAEGQIVSKWIPWNDFPVNKWHKDLPRPGGVYLTVRRQTVERFCERQQASFAWMVSLNAYNREHGWGAFEKISVTRCFGESSVIR